MPVLKGFVGGSYTSQSPNVDDQASINWYPEFTEDPNSKTPIAQYSTPGSQLFTALTGPSVRAIYEYTGRVFAVCGSNFYEIMANGTNVSRGTVAVDGNPASMVGSPIIGGTAILVASAGVPYVFNMQTNVLTAVDPTTLSNVLQVLFCDGFCIALLGGTNQWQYSNPNDPTTWDDSNETAIEFFADAIVAMNIIFRTPYFFGPKQTVPYASGNTLDPFEFAVVPGGFTEIGCGATWSTAVVGGENGSIFFLGQTAAGGRMFYRMNQYTPVRISNHAIEYALSQYSTVSDAVSYAYQDQGHWFYVTYFPTANVTWVYDVSTGMWHQRAYWNNGKYEAHHSQCYAFGFGKHLVGDWKSGNVYEMNINFYADVGAPIRRLRRAATMADDQKRIPHRKLQIEFETGLGPQPPLLDGDENPRGPIAMLRWSNDNGHTWSNTRSYDCGQAGNFNTRMIARRLGNPRNRTYELTVTDPIPWRIVNAYLNNPDNERSDGEY